MPMRDDSRGLWWEDLPPVRGGKRGPRERGPVPPIPDTGWSCPTELPNIGHAKVIGLDTETYDPDLTKSGPGWGRNSGHIVGISLSVEDGSSWYFPIRHGWESGKQILPEKEAAMNWDPQVVLSWAQSVLGGNQPKVGANLIYDIGWLKWEGVNVGGQLYDIQFAEALLNSETPKVDLDSLAHRYLHRGKETNVLYEWLSAWIGGKPNEKQRANLYLTPPSLAGPYAEGDASLPIAILTKQWPELVKRGVVELFHMECDLINLLVDMRMKGAPVDINKAEQVYEELTLDLDIVAEQLRVAAGQEVNVNAAESLRSAFGKIGITIPSRKDKKTGEVKETFAAGQLESIEHPFCEKVLEYRRIAKVRDTFVKSYIMDKSVNGKLHCSFHPLKGAEKGARSGRFASSDPNLQNIPVRTEIGKRVRTIFVATAGGRWRKADYSQIEYRLLAHHAVGPGADKVRATYNENPDVDYHEMTGGMVLDMTGIELQRRKIKNVNFGLVYGMSEPALAALLGLNLSEAKHLFKAYHEAIPFARKTMEQCANEVDSNGYVTTILGRKSDFPLWERKYDWGEPRDGYQLPLPLNAARSKWGSKIVRAYRHKALNRKLQGGAADIMKAAMVKCYKAGLFHENACGMPCLTVHDELDFDDHTDPDSPAWKEFKHMMETAVLGKVPFVVDQGIGPNWGEAD